MSKRAARAALAVGVALATVGFVAAPALATQAQTRSSGRSATTHVVARAASNQPPGTNAGPPYAFTTELMGVAPNLNVKDQMILTRTQLGYRLWSGQQDSHLTITIVDGLLKFRDTGTKFYKKLSSQCTKERVKVGISALCRIPGGISVAQPLLIEVWPRLGNDYTDSSTLPAEFSVSMLGDEGNDVAKFGAGWDFFNGHLGRDRIYAGAGNDWIRSGGGSDVIDAGAGNDDIVGMDGNERVLGGTGDDRIWTGAGDDDLNSGAGTDLLVCGTGVDAATAELGDHVSRSCETTKTVTGRRATAHR